MRLQERIDLLVWLGSYIIENNDDFRQAKDDAYRQNPWFIPEFIEISTFNIAKNFLKREHLENFADQYHIPESIADRKNVGIVMAGNIPLVGFHDFLCVFLSGYRATIKLSSKDEILLKHLVNQMQRQNQMVEHYVSFAEQLKGCDAYIATGSNNSSRYFEYYFAKYPHIIRKNRTSAAILTGNESAAELEMLSDDIQFYFGLGCRNVTKLYVPEGYDFEPLLNALKQYDHFMDHHKYRHNYDYQLALAMMNRKFYMTNGSILLLENESLFSAVSVVHYAYYKEVADVQKDLKSDVSLQCTVGENHLPFGSAQSPGICDYADGLDTMEFLMKLHPLSKK